MSQLTKEQFEKALKVLATKRGLELSRVELKQQVKRRQEEPVRIVNGGFDDVLKRLDVKEQIIIFERKFKKLEEALHIKL